MKFIFSALISLLIFSANAQETERKFVFKEVSWSISIPVDFEILDAEADKANNEKGKKLFESALGSEIDVSTTRTLISATKNKHNFFNSTITPYDIEVDGNWKTNNQLVKDVMFTGFTEEFKKQGLDFKIDSTTGTTLIDGLLFHQYNLDIQLNGKYFMTVVLLSKLHKGFDFGISYVYLEDEFRNQVETMLKNSSFKK